MTNHTASTPPDAGQSLSEQIEVMIDALPAEHLHLGELLKVLGDEGLLVLTIMLTLVFLIPVSIPGVSTVFGAVILLIGISRLGSGNLWLPEKLKSKLLPVDKLRPGLKTGLKWVRRMERISRPHRLSFFVDGRMMQLFNNLGFILAALLLMAPFGFVPFSNTLPGIALLLYAVGFIQRDGIAVLLGHLANIGTMIYFTVLLAGGGVALTQLLQKVSG
ncbi:exopolysaccharide biosynthesis protein [Lysobacteraceae bacterium NML71-0210]|nr:exopolysaccharide biosynthesis protein [Xanthomonadaceae bacterium NML71-0210]